MWYLAMLTGLLVGIALAMYVPPPAHRHGEGSFALLCDTQICIA
jgi:hypothetical protein